MATRDCDKQPGDDQGNICVLVDVPTYQVYIHLVEHVHNVVLSPRVPKRCERANYTNITLDILHTYACHVIWSHKGGLALHSISGKRTQILKLLFIGNQHVILSRYIRHGMIRNTMLTFCFFLPSCSLVWLAAARATA